MVNLDCETVFPCSDSNSIRSNGGKKSNSFEWDITEQELFTKLGNYLVLHCAFGHHVKLSVNRDICNVS